MDKKIAETWDYLLELGVNEDVLKTVTNINGYNIESLNDIIYAKFGYHDLEQLKNS